MTLVVAATEPGSIWLSVDRRLSREGHPPRDDARKMMLLDTQDGKAILGYAGLGATALGNEPADWMSAVLRGWRLTLEQSLGVLAEAARRQLPRHLVRLPKNVVPGHNIIVPALVQNEARLYSIDLVLSPDRKNYTFRYTRHVTNINPTVAGTPRLAIGGSGAIYLMRRTKWRRELLSILKAYNRERLSANAVADHFAALNHEVHRNLESGTVGPRCIVAWRNGRDGARRGGGAHCFYTGTTRESDPASLSLPIIGSGMDVRALINLMMPRFVRNLEELMAGQPSTELDKDQVNAELACLPDKPDEKLR